MSVAATSHINYQTYSGSILVVALKMPDGKGDIDMGYKIYKIMQETLGAASFTFSYFDAYYPGYSKQPVLITPQEAADWEVTKIQTVYEKIQKKEFDLIIITSAFSDNMLPNQIRYGGIPLVKIRECGAGKADPELVLGPVYTMGIAEGQIGILFPEHLLRRYISPRQNDKVTGLLDTYVCKDKKVKDLVMEYAGLIKDSPTKEMSLSRLQNLSILPEEILNCILRTNVEKDFQKRLAAFNAHTRLYCGYGRAHEFNNMIAFIHGLCASFPASDNENITLYFLNDYPNEPLESDGGTIFFDEAIDQDRLSRLKFTSIHIYSMSQGKITEKTIPLVEKPKNRKKTQSKVKEKPLRALNLLFLPLKPKQVDALAMASERESFSAGESTFFKFLALGAFASHDARDHKLAFIKDLIDLLNQSNPSLAQLLIDCYYGSEAIYKKNLNNQNPPIDTAKITVGMSEFFKAFRAPEGKPSTQQKKEMPKHEVYRTAWNNFTASLSNYRFENFVPVILQHLPPKQDPKSQPAKIEVMS